MGDDSVVVVAAVLFVVVVVVVFLRGSNRCLPQHRWIQSYHYNTSGHGKTLSYNGLRQMGLIIFQ